MGISKNISTILKDNLCLTVSTTIFILITSLILLSLSRFSIDSEESARYLFSSIAQSQAAIVAIVITLTLVAVQLASQNYTPRLMDLFLKDKFFWFLLVFYSISIVYHIAFLSIIDRNFSYLVTIPFKFELTLKYFIYPGLVLFISSFIVLFIFVNNVITQLKPEQIVHKLAKVANLEDIESSGENKFVDYSLISLKEIGDKSIISLNEFTAVTVIEEITKIAEIIIEKRTFKDENIESDEYIVNIFLDILTNFATLSLTYKTTNVLDAVISSFNKIGILVSDKNSYLAKDVLKAIKDIDRSIPEKGFHNNILEIKTAFGQISVNAAKNELWDVVEYSVGMIGLFVSEFKNKESEPSDEDRIYNGHLGSSQESRIIIDSIKNIGMEIVDTVPNLGDRDAIRLDDDLFKRVILINSSIDNLKVMANIATLKEWDFALTPSVCAIKDICGSLFNAGENLSHPINPIVRMSESFEYIATLSTSQAVYYETKSMISILESYCDLLLKKQSKNAQIVIDSLINIFDYVYMNYCTPTPCDMISGMPSSLGNLGLTSMVYDNNFLIDSTTGEPDFEGIEKPVTQKIVDNIVNIGIMANRKPLNKHIWDYVVQSSVKYVLFFTIKYIKMNNETVSEYLIHKLLYMQNSFNDKSVIPSIMREVESRKSFGIYENILNEVYPMVSEIVLDENILNEVYPMVSEIVLDDDDLEAYYCVKEKLYQTTNIFQ